MNHSNLIKQALLLIALILPLLSACSPQAAKEKTFDWKEEIQLHDGRKIIVERFETPGGWAEPGNKGVPQKNLIKFTDPSNPNKKYEHFVTGSSNYIMLDFEAGVPWLAIHTGPFNNHSRCPIASYEILTFKEDQWRMVPLASKPERLKDYNMLSLYSSNQPPRFDYRQENKQLNWETIQKAMELRKNPPNSSRVWKFISEEHGKPTDCFVILQNQQILNDRAIKDVRK
jgi:hypothetical protein